MWGGPDAEGRVSELGDASFAEALPSTAKASSVKSDSPPDPVTYASGQCLLRSGPAFARRTPGKPNRWGVLGALGEPVPSDGRSGLLHFCSMPGWIPVPRELRNIII